MKSQPAPVDYVGAAEAEGAANRQLIEQQTWANRPTQINPWGTTAWQNTPTYDPTTAQNINRWTQTQTLSPALQEALSYQMGLTSGRSQLGYGMLGNIAQEIGNPMDWSQFGTMEIPNAPQQMNLNAGPQLWGDVQRDLPTYETTGTLRNLNFGGAPNVNAPQQTWQRAEDSVYNRAMGRIQPQQQSELLQAEIKLRNQGLSPGDQIYQSTMQSLSQKHNDANQNAINESIMAGGNEAQRMFGMETGYRNQYIDEYQRAADFFNQSGQQQFGQQMTAGGQSFQDLLAAANFQNDARKQALGEQAGALGYNQDSTYRYADYYNKLREQAINEMVTQRGYSLNEANALIAGQQVGLPQFGQFSQAGAAQAPQYLQAAGLTGQQNAATAGAENSFWNSMFGGVGTAAGIYGMFG